MKTKNSDEVMTVVEVAGYLKVSLSTVWNWCRAGKIPAFKLAHQWRVRKRDLNRAIEEGMTEQRAPELRKEPERQSGSGVS